MSVAVYNTAIINRVWDSLSKVFDCDFYFKNARGPSTRDTVSMIVADVRLSYTSLPLKNVHRRV